MKLSVEQRVVVEREEYQEVSVEGGREPKGVRVLGRYRLAGSWL
jgi:hypothetical protein